MRRWRIYKEETGARSSGECGEEKIRIQERKRPGCVLNEAKGIIKWSILTN